MIQQMLSFAQQGGRPRSADVDLAHVLDLVLQDVCPLARRGDAQIVVGELPRVVGDADLIYSVLLNLMTNAIKFTRPGEPPEVTISAEQRERHWRIRVDDNGIGVPEDRRESMFDLFTRDDHDRVGHGIGLATARRIIDAHGGAIGMEGSASGGTSVWFDLPL
jgi:signal transduction histidine kinase